MNTTALVVGNPKMGSRTLAAGRAVLNTLRPEVARADETIIELALYATRIFDAGDEELMGLAPDVASARLLVVASPTYKATYTGLLKAFFDRFGSDALAGVVAVPVMMGAADVHAMAAEVHLRPLLVELGATVPCRSLFVLESSMDRLDEVVDAWAERAGPVIEVALHESTEFRSRGAGS